MECSCNLPKKTSTSSNFSVISLSYKARAPTIIISYLTTQAFFEETIAFWARLSQRHVPMPLVLLECHPIPKTHLKTYSILESLPTTPDCLPHPHSIILSRLSSTPPPQSSIITHFQRGFLSLTNLQHHFPIKALLRMDKFFMPKPPF